MKKSDLTKRCGNCREFHRLKGICVIKTGKHRFRRAGWLACSDWKMTLDYYISKCGEENVYEKE